MNRIIVSLEKNSFYNLSLEEELLFQAQSNETILYLWINEPCVIIGRNQVPFMECNMEYTRNKNINIVRRNSGGGAVYQDLGNLNYTFINKIGEKNTEKQKKLLLEVLNELGIKGYFSGRNDILINQKKISGQAEYSEDDNEYLHGTLMINVNMENLEKSLIPSSNKLKSKGIKSIKSRVINISEYNKDINIEQVKEIMIRRFQEIFGKVEKIEYFSEKEKEILSKKKYQSEDWNINESPQYSVKVEIPFDDSNLKLWIQIKNGKIEKIKYSSDSLKSLSFSYLNSFLINQPFNEEKIKKIILENI